MCIVHEDHIRPKIPTVHIDDLREPHASIFRIPEQLHGTICARGHHKAQEVSVADGSLIDASLVQEAISMLSSRFPFKSAESINKAVRDALAYFTGENISENDLNSMHVLPSNGTHYQIPLMKEVAQNVQNSSMQTEPEEQAEFGS